MTILVTGDQGFIGSHVTKELRKHGHFVYGADLKSGQDIADGYTFGKFIEGLGTQPEMIVHIAGSCSTQKGLDKPGQDFRDNAIATFNICEAARYLNIPVIYTSTCKVEPNEEGIRTPYGLSKYIGEQYLHEFSKCYGLEFIINRMGTIYGPGQDGSPESGWIAWFIKCAVEKLKLTIFGDGKQVRDILYIDDLVNLLYDQTTHFAEYKNKVYQVGGGIKNAINLLDAVKMLEIKDVTHGPERTGDSKRYVADNTEVSKVRGWEPLVNWLEGLQKTWAYYKK